MSKYNQPIKLKLEASLDEEKSDGLIFDGMGYYPASLKSKTEYLKEPYKTFAPQPTPLMLQNGQFRASLIEQPVSIQIRDSLSGIPKMNYEGKNLFGYDFSTLHRENIR